MYVCIINTLCIIYWDFNALKNLKKCKNDFKKLKNNSFKLSLYVEWYYGSVFFFRFLCMV